ncbi:MAG TPA: RHS repeat-associated core domain-containing protein [Candidatus Scatovicinus merdipullorum]|nr:RHS repeat-associated core domain-containing protein [Candidatus Scatovicinus merdipullorum]
MYCSRLIKGLSGNEVTSENHIGNLNKIRYRGYYQDTETGFYYLMSRYYDPVTHRFLNADGYFQTGTGVLDTNMSAYCANNPVNFLDPTGQYRVCPTHGSFYSQPNCVGCRPDFQQALDRYSQIMAKRKKVQVSVGTKTETSSSAPWWTPISSYSGSIQGTITHSSSENSKYYLEHLTISTGRNETTTGYALDIESFHYQNYSSEGRLGGKVGWSDETTVNSIGLISGNGKLNIEWDTTVTNGTSYVTNYSGYSISPTMGIAVAVIVAAVITAGPAGATQIIHDLSPA